MEVYSYQAKYKLFNWWRLGFYWTPISSKRRINYGKSRNCYRLCLYTGRQFYGFYYYS